MSPPARVVWIEIALDLSLNPHVGLSPPARVVWIEIAMSLAVASACVVATREGGVD